MEGTTSPHAILWETWRSTWENGKGHHCCRGNLSGEHTGRLGRSVGEQLPTYFVISIHSRQCGGGLSHSVIQSVNISVYYMIFCPIYCELCSKY